jgi:hypothetical protein
MPASYAGALTKGIPAAYSAMHLASAGGNARARGPASVPKIRAIS